MPDHTEPPELSWQETSEQFRLLVEQVQDYAIFLIDPGGCIRTWNLGAERISGYGREEIIGRSYGTFFTEEDRAAGRPERLMGQARTEGRTEDEGWRVRKDGSRFWAHAVLTALYGDDGRLRGYAKLSQDLNTRREAEARALELAREQATRAAAEAAQEHLEEQLQVQARLNAALEELGKQREQALTEARRQRDITEQAHKALRTFLGVVVHDLRNPLAVIMSYAGLLTRRAPAVETTAEAAGQIEAQAQRMDRMIGSLLEALRIGAGQLEITPEPMDLGLLAQQVVEAHQVTTRDHRLVLDTLDPVKGSWDPSWLAHVLDNLVGNAIKYSPHGGEIRVVVAEKDDQAVVSVADQGIGVSPEDRERLFQLFTRVDPDSGAEGSGLGLYIARGVVEAHGGRIWVESAGQGQGSTFSFTLPKDSTVGLSLLTES